MLDYEEKRKRSYESYEDITKMVGQISDVDGTAKPKLLKQIVYGIASLTLELHLIRLMMESKEGWHFDD